ncbi:1-acyl-sn-glycerol-3-phosphate acyltransferase [Candidatus Gastranaerophilus sp. (ex Termes propinquus)]|nr:1-acyl-sn-glycerol-3-phosphate acyltransferase [Candidatus Gastranaerophilus sp. (ex Termes propinquus)]
MLFWRKLVVFFFFVLFGLGAGIISFILFPLGTFFAKDKKRYYSNTIRYSWKLLIKLLALCKIIKLEIPEHEKISKIRGKIIVASHPSLIDIVILMSLIPECVCMAKKELVDNFLLKNILKRICITNDVSAEEFEKSATAALLDGFNIIIFPTGTRSREGEKTKMHKGAALLAISTNTPLVPLTIKTSYKFLASGQSILEVRKKPVVYEIRLKDEIDTANFKNAGYEISLRNSVCVKIKESIS